jgi:hypothetical protein
MVDIGESSVLDIGQEKRVHMAGRFCQYGQGASWRYGKFLASIIFLPRYAIHQVRIHPAPRHPDRSPDHHC